MDPFAEFRDMINPFLNDWKTLDFRVLALRPEDQKDRKEAWQFNTIRIILENSRQPLIELPTAPDLLVNHEHRGIQDLETVLDGITKGEIQTNGQVVQITHNGNPIAPHAEFLPRNYSRQKLGIDCACFLLSIWESVNSSRSEFQKIETFLRSHDPPWDGIRDLKENFLGIPTHSSSRLDGAVLDLIAPLRVWLADSKLQNDRLEARINKSPSTPTREISLSLISKLTKDKTFRGKFPVEWSLENDSNSLPTIVTLPTSPSRLKMILTYRGIDVDDKEHFGRNSSFLNSRAKVMEVIAGGTQELQDSLVDARGHKFERGIALLLHLLGFSPAHYGSGSGETPDILAFPDSGKWILVIECTASSPDWNNKLTKLATRKKEIHTNLEGIEVLPVLITSGDRSIVGDSDSDKASKERIVIVTSDEIPRLFEMMLEGTTPEDVRNFLETLIPYRTDLQAAY